jgi:hypothetical protein
MSERVGMAIALYNVEEAPVRSIIQKPLAVLWLFFIVTILLPRSHVFAQSSNQSSNDLPLFSDETTLNWEAVHRLFGVSQTLPTIGQDSITIPTRRAANLPMESRRFNVVDAKQRFSKHGNQSYLSKIITARSGSQSLYGARIEIGGETAYRIYLHNEASITEITFHAGDSVATTRQLKIPAETDNDQVFPPTNGFSNSTNNNPPPTSNAIGTSNLSMMMVFTTASLNLSGGLANMLAALNASIAESNDTFANLQFVSGEIAEVNAPDKTVKLKLYSGALKDLVLSFDSSTQITGAEEGKAELKVGAAVDVRYDPASKKATYIYIYS